ncbi:hypothetical protein [Sinosporangium siamense]|uniref:hypothetical protein n=1 Tax=Sinosporangium siamense TaxID=1367973 RepID=UPI001951B300|nr:hypothetical protein [Sinosporangium siamense]
MIFIGTLFLTYQLVTLGAKGAEIANILALPIGIFTGFGGLMVGLFGLFRHHVPPADLSAPPVMRRRRPRLWASIVTVALAIGLATTYWFGIHKPDITLGAVAVENGGEMRGGTQASIAIPMSPTTRDYLALTVDIRNTSPTGACVDPARMDFLPILDGQAKRPLAIENVASGQEVRLRLGDTTREAVISLVLHQPDPACVVSLTVSEAVLYN